MNICSTPSKGTCTLQTHSKPLTLFPLPLSIDQSFFPSVANGFSCLLSLLNGNSLHQDPSKSIRPVTLAEASIVLEVWVSRLEMDYSFIKTLLSD